MLTVIAYDDQDEAVAIANDSDYGLAGSVFTADTDRGLAVAAAIRTGTFGVNQGYTMDPFAPFGGVKASGYGRELGREGIDGYTDTKSICRGRRPQSNFRCGEAGSGHAAAGKGSDAVTTVETHDPNFARPGAPHRRPDLPRRRDCSPEWCSLGMTIGVGVGLIAPTFTVRRHRQPALRRAGDPASARHPVGCAPGENRTRLDKAAELTLFYLPYTACSQIGYELMFLIGHPLGWWTPTTDPGWKWLWWQYALADTRYVSGNPWIFAPRGGRRRSPASSCSPCGRG